MDAELKQAIEKGELEVERILDGFFHVKDVATGKVSKWVDGKMTEIESEVDAVVSNVKSQVRKNFSGGKRSEHI